MILGLPYDKSTDIFSYGIILGEIMTRKEPTERDPEIGYQGTVSLLVSVSCLT
jgi:hypothetical protein